MSARPAVEAAAISQYRADLQEFHARGTTYGELRMRNRVVDLLYERGMGAAASAVIQAFPADSIVKPNGEPVRDSGQSGTGR